MPDKHGRPTEDDLTAEQRAQFPGGVVFGANSRQIDGDKHVDRDGNEIPPKK